jgi:hypothetical protein
VLHDARDDVFSMEPSPHRLEALQDPYDTILAASVDPCAFAAQGVDQVRPHSGHNADIDQLQF